MLWAPKRPLPTRAYSSTGGSGQVPMGILIPIGLLIVLALVPFWIDRRDQGVAQWFNREGRAAQVIVIVMVVVMIALTIMGLLPQT